MGLEEGYKEMTIKGLMHANFSIYKNYNIMEQ